MCWEILAMQENWCEEMVHLEGDKDCPGALKEPNKKQREEPECTWDIRIFA